jgi:hypothetical protein
VRDLNYEIQKKREREREREELLFQSERGGAATQVAWERQVLAPNKDT